MRGGCLWWHALRDNRPKPASESTLKTTQVERLSLHSCPCSPGGSLWASGGISSVEIAECESEDTAVLIGGTIQSKFIARV